MHNKIKCTNCGFSDHHYNANFCSYCGEKLIEKNLCLNEDCRNSKIEHCHIDNDSKYCNLCGSLTVIGEFDRSR
jgi:hypothetical protein